jgi:V8-like Glu-specific endopeptidase
MAFVLAGLALPTTAPAFGLQGATASTMPTAMTSNGVPQVGALYANATAGWHGCTATVVHSTGGNVLVTAAHCVSGKGAGMAFAPGQHGTQAPFGRWTVTAVHLEPAWVAHQDPRADIAFLTVAPRTLNRVTTQIERVTGAYKLGGTAVSAQRVTVPAYPAGSTNNPITCTATVYLTSLFPAFNCRGYVGGVSGSPWLLATPGGTQVVGVVGGLHQGGCFNYTSYSSPLAADAYNAYVRASNNAPADIAPRPGGDGC